MTSVTLTITIDVSQVEAVGRAVNEVICEKDGSAIAAVKGKTRLANATGVDPLPSSPSPDLSLVQATPAAEATPPASAATNLAGRNSDSSDSAILPAPAIETPAIAARQAGISQTEDQTPEDRAATLSQRERKPLRPFCRRLEGELCGGYGKKHCGTCERAAGAQAA